MTKLCSKTGKLKLSRKSAMASAAWWRNVRMVRMKHYFCKCGDYHIANDRGKPRHAR